MKAQHEWTHDADTVLLVKCLNRDGTSHNGFKWPQVGETIEDARWDGKPTCDGGGFFGWPWGFGVGDGREANAIADWIVFAALPVDIIGFGQNQKAKARKAHIVYRGSMGGAMGLTQVGRVAWVIAHIFTGARATGESGNASATGESGIAAASGLYSTVEAGPGGIAATTSGDAIWEVHADAIFVQTWKDESGQWQHACLSARTLGLTTGQVVKVVKGKVEAA